MDIFEINIVLDALREKRKKPQEELRQLDKLIAEYELKLENEKRKSQQVANSVLTFELPTSISDNILASSSMLFPTSSNIKAQILFVLDIVKKPLKMSEIEEELKTRTGKDLNIKEFVRNMQKNKQVTLMKINNSNRMSYWVKPEWVDKESNTLKNEHKLENMDMLYTTSQIEFS